MPQARHQPIPMGDEVSATDVARYLPAVLRVARRLLPQDAGAAEDLAQDVMMALLTKCHAIPRDRVLRWLFCATELAARQERRRYSRNAGGLAKWAAHVLNVPTTVSAPAVVDLVELRRTVGKLSQHRKKILLLLMLGHSYDAIARALNVSVNTVKDHRSKALAAIRHAMNHDGTEAEHG